MSEQTPARLAAQDIQALFDASPFMSTLNLKVLELDYSESRLTVRMPLHPGLERRVGTKQFHGGSIASFIDVVGDFAVGEDFLLGEFGAFRVHGLRLGEEGVVGLVPFGEGLDLLGVAGVLRGEFGFVVAFGPGGVGFGRGGSLGGGVEFGREFLDLRFVLGVGGRQRSNLTLGVAELEHGVAETVAELGVDGGLRVFVGSSEEDGSEEQERESETFHGRERARTWR